MMLHIPGVLTKAQVAQCRELLDAAEWVDGNATSGAQSALAKRNRQLPEGAPAARAVGDAIRDALARHPLFSFGGAAAQGVPAAVQSLRRRRDVRHARRQRDQAAARHGFRARSDLSATLFLEEPDAYDGGELCVEDTYGTHRAKLPAGDPCCIRRRACITSRP